MARRVLRASVTDGQLTLQVRDLGGADPNAVINGFEVIAADPVRVDFGTASSPVEAGFMAGDEGHRWAAPLWCGWSAGKVGSRDRGTGSDLLRDLNVTQDATFACAVGRGLWNLTLTLGDAAAPHDQMGLFLEGNLAGTVSTAARQFAVTRYRLAIADGELTARFDDLGGSDVNVVVNAIEAVRVGPFDFGPPLSQVAAGYTAVTQGTRYSSASGFGWLEGVVGSRDRGAGSALLRDFVMTGAATFAVDVPNGVYDVSVLIGDATVAHDEIAVILEGVQAAVVSTAKGQVHARTYRTAVADGQLAVRLVDLGGADANAVINGLSIAPAP